MVLSEKQLEDICLLNQGSQQCRYLEDVNSSTYICKKKSINDKRIIDEEVKSYLQKCQSNNINPYLDDDKPLGDHCQGFLPLTVLLQGYDV